MSYNKRQRSRLRLLLYLTHHGAVSEEQQLRHPGLDHGQGELRVRRRLERGRNGEKNRRKSGTNRLESGPSRAPTAPRSPSPTSPPSPRPWTATGRAPDWRSARKTAKNAPRKVRSERLSSPTKPGRADYYITALCTVCRSDQEHSKKFRQGLRNRQSRQGSAYRTTRSATTQTPM